MNEMLVAVFDTEDAADKGLHALKALHQEGGISLCESQNAEPDAVYPATVCGRRGSRTVNSVKSPTSLSTVMVPPCCWVTIS